MQNAKTNSVVEHIAAHRWILSGALAAGIVALALLPLGCSDDCQDDCPDASSSSSSSTGGNFSELALQYCDCMLLSCHNSYHNKFGPDSDEEAARANCLAEAETLPVADMDVQSGDFIECRIHHCEIGMTDESACPSSVGDGMCQ